MIVVLKPLKLEWQCSQYLTLNPTCVIDTTIGTTTCSKNSVSIANKNLIWNSTENSVVNLPNIFHYFDVNKNFKHKLFAQRIPRVKCNVAEEDFWVFYFKLFMYYNTSFEVLFKTLWCWFSEEHDILTKMFYLKTLRKSTLFSITDKLLSDIATMNTSKLSYKENIYITFWGYFTWCSEKKMSKLRCVNVRHFLHKTIVKNVNLGLNFCIVLSFVIVLYF